jgi:hypothetical protein
MTAEHPSVTAARKLTPQTAWPDPRPDGLLDVCTLIVGMPGGLFTVMASMYVLYSGMEGGWGIVLCLVATYATVLAPLVALQLKRDAGCHPGRRRDA